MASEFTFLISGIVLGLGSGLTPGPLLTLVISETLKHGIKEGVKVSIAPIFTDLPIVLGTIFLLSRLSDIMPVLGVISFLGAGFLVYLSFELISFKGEEIDIGKITPQSVKKGIIVNFLNPAPYMFWFTVGAPTALRAFEKGLVFLLSFIVSFYILLVGSKTVVAIIAGKSRRFLRSRNYVYSMRLLGIVLLIFAIVFIYNGLRYFDLV
jgi:threonine/homoserine/homoserine lactone efflux protein